MSKYSTILWKASVKIDNEEIYRMAEAYNTDDVVLKSSYSRLQSVLADLFSEVERYDVLVKDIEQIDDMILFKSSKSSGIVVRVKICPECSWIDERVHKEDCPIQICDDIHSS